MFLYTPPNNIHGNKWYIPYSDQYGVNHIIFYYNPLYNNNNYSGHTNDEHDFSNHDSDEIIGKCSGNLSNITNMDSNKIWKRQQNNDNNDTSCTNNRYSNDIHTTTIQYAKVRVQERMMSNMCTKDEPSLFQYIGDALYKANINKFKFKKILYKVLLLNSEHNINQPMES